MDSIGGASLPSSCPDARKRRVSYFYEPTIGDYYYGQGHPMKPHRIRMAHNLIVHYSLNRRMEISQPFPADSADIRSFHSPEYVDFLASVTPDTLHDHTHVRHLKRFNVSEDCPVFDGLFSFCQASAGGSIGAAVKLNRQDADIAINWAGGLHHAKKSEASGFCYVNDIVLGILELLKVHRRVLYVDIDIHHGDGVEEAFYVTDRVMTVSFHKFGDFFPGTGHIKNFGVGAGKYYALNVPLKDGTNDENFRSLFRPIIFKVMDVYQPDAVVLQCGADSLAGDRLGCFNLSIKGHADCLRYLRSFNVPLMVLGGGGYTIRNVARCWCYETAVAVNVEPDNKLPYNEYYEYFGPDYTLHVEPDHLKNLNTESELEKIRNMLLDQLSQLQHVPSVPFQTMPPTTESPEEREEDMEVRAKPRIWNGEEDYESEDDENEKPWRRSDRTLQAGVKEMFQKKRKKGKPSAPMAPPSAQTSSDQPSNSDKATAPPPPLEQPEVEARSESAAADIADVSFRHCKGKKALAINVDLAEEKTSPLDARPYPDSHSFMNAEVGPAAFEVLRRFISSADRQVIQEMSPKTLIEEGTTRAIQAVLGVQEMAERMVQLEQTITYCKDKELKLKDKLGASRAKVVELEATIVTLQEKVAAAVTAKETAYLQADKEVQAAKAEVERVKDNLEQEKEKLSNYMGLEAERHRQFGEAHWEERKAAFLKSEEYKAKVAVWALDFFEHGFEGAVAQFRAQGYPPKGANTDFLDAFKVLEGLPPEAFDKKP